MEDNEHATATSGADTPLEGVATHAEAPTGETFEEPLEISTDEVENYRGRNEELRHRFLLCNRRIQEAKAAGDTEAEMAAREERDQIGNEFVEANIKLAVHNSSSFLIGDAENKKDHMQAALLGMWEAFVGVDASKVDDVIVDEDGDVHAASGWDPSRGTFATLAGTYISGQTRRSVKKTESAYTGMSYNTWSEKPKVDRARRVLTDKLGRTPTYAEIATEAGVTIATVQACSTATPVSLQTLVSDDGSTTLGDLLADATNVDLGDDVAELAERELIARARQMSTLDLMVLALRTGVTGRDPLTVNRTADKLCVGRGAAQLAIKRALSALVPEMEVPASASCECGEKFAYDWDKEPKLELTEFDLPEGLDEMIPEMRKAALARWTAEVDAAHARQHADYEKVLASYRTKARRAYDRFVKKHRQHKLVVANGEQSTALAELLV